MAQIVNNITNAIDVAWIYACVLLPISAVMVTYFYRMTNATNAETLTIVKMDRARADFFNGTMELLKGEALPPHLRLVVTHVAVAVLSDDNLRPERIAKPRRREMIDAELYSEIRFFMKSDREAYKLLRCVMGSAARIILSGKKAYKYTGKMSCGDIRNTILLMLEVMHHASARRRVVS